MKKFVVPMLLVIAIGLSGLFVARFFFGGNEDDWICVNNQWVKHGNPSAPMPQSGCGTVSNNWKTETVEEVGVTFSYPPDTTFRKEVASDSAGIHVVGFYVEKKDYTLYGVYQPNKEASQQDIELAKKEMDSATIKEVTVAGYKGIEGLIVGPKTRYITILLKNSRLLTISTMPPTQENKALTEKILATVTFN